ncbi:DUF4959 domain-containing protein [Pedobacter sp. MC2016-14]|uniref:DUF5000 domain-containing lipoprotein n=1 Tax=Pedobacter sp. MC2016-14 TaxID=2897327 RepID=UPI001E542AA1|nr:DUF4959 domain-containing protein [Pedobacter sp. MC2016-14]MCD0487248.1 DUF4959 domain-containing protein [Pedobacter sp. MC2016-14]
MIPKNKLTILFILLIAVAMGCKKNNKGFNEVISGDLTKPDVVSNIKVDNFNGGANITYDLPNSPNILYVQAKYKINGSTSREAKSSYYQDTIVVNGFAEAKSYEVTLYTVSRANVMSDPVTVTVNPTIPVYKLVRPSLNMVPDFGGVSITASNPTKKEVGLVFLAYNANTRAMEIQDQFFSKLETIDYAVRGFKAESQDFAIYVTDKWGNVSDTLKKTLTPIFEEALDKSKFSTLTLASDAQLAYSDWPTTSMWDGRTDGNGWHSADGGQLPFTVTFGVGRSYKLSRFVLYERTGQFTYNNGNPKEFSLWGSNVASPTDRRLPLVAAEGTVLGDWINLGNFKFPNPPSGSSPGSTTSADEDFVKKGVEFRVPLQAPAVRYLRVAIASTWGTSGTAYIMEITPFGTPL